MWRAEKRRISDRKFIQYKPEEHFVRAYAVSASNACSWDMFSPVKGYRPYNAGTKRSYNVSPKRQHTDWARMVVERDGYKCQKCGENTNLEAHHIWPQSWFPQFRYILKNGVTLCRQCHDEAFHAHEITPGQFLELTNEIEKINSIIEETDFWENYTAGLEKGRVLAYQLSSTKEMHINKDEKEYFVSWAAMNNFLERTECVTRDGPIKDNKYKVSEEMRLSILSYDIYS
ncbi:MAG: HNH endonuclease [Gammaproteobacteria bacterium]|nr:HNH endonuclease [Gammaproteobacteria bacterium]MCF6260096.1 HNH endonuclease [Gammaproteobacteria bacterium]